MAPSFFNATAAAGSLPTPAQLLLPVSFDSTLGAMLVGTLISYGVFGVNLHQAWRYHNQYSHSDTWAIRSVVFGMILADIVHSIQCAHVCYYYLVQNYSRPVALLSGIWTINLLPISSAVIIMLAQSFYARRVYLTNKRLAWLVVFIVVLMVTELGFTIGGCSSRFPISVFVHTTRTRRTAAGVETYLSGTFQNWLHYVWVDSVALGVAIGVDLILTFTAIGTLWSNRTGFKNTDNVLNVLIVWTLNTCLLTSMLTVMTMICSILWPENFIYIAINLVATKTYSSAVLAVLNSRESLSTRITISGALQQTRSQRSIAGDNWQMMPMSPSNATFEIMTPNTATAFNKSQGLLAEPRGAHTF
ncbi:hypothetical protein V8D89_001610 [Ganoderma adspersum]